MLNILLLCVIIAKSIVNNTYSTNRVLRTAQKYRPFGHVICHRGPRRRCWRRVRFARKSFDGSTMGDIVNLRKVRKQVGKRQDAEWAAANRLRFGRPKAERDRQA